MAREQLGTTPSNPKDAATKGSVETALGGVPTTVGKALVTAANAAAAKGAINADYVINVKDYGAVGDGEADDTDAILNAIAALPELDGVYTNIYESLNRETQGGGTVVIPPGVYKISEPIIVGGRVNIQGWGATLVAAHASACVKAIQDPAPDIFSAIGPTIQGLTFDGNDIATNGFWIQSTLQTGLLFCTAFHTSGDGFRLEGTQYAVLDRCAANECGGWGLVVTKNSATSEPDGNNNTFIRFFAEMNTLGGVKLYDGAIQNTFFGLTSQFQPTGVGLLMSGSPVAANSVFGAHFEQNEVDLEFDGGSYNQVYSPVFWRGPETTRHVICNSIGNVVNNPILGSVDGPQVRRAGTTACYEVGAAGTLTVENPRRITGSGNFAADGSRMFVDQSGNSLDPKINAFGDSRVVVKEFSDPRQTPETYFNKHTYAAAFSGEPLLATRLTTDAHDRLTGYANGNLAWGSGSAAVDTTLSRLSAGKLAVGSAEIVTVSDQATLTNKTITSPRVDEIRDTNGNRVISLGNAATAVNYIAVWNAQNGAHPIIYATGSSTNVGMYFIPRGNGALMLYGESGQSSQTISAQGSAADVSLNLTSQGSGSVNANGTPVALNSATSTHTCQQLELGNASDTTLTRTSAGMVAVEGNPLGVRVAIPATNASTGASGQWAADNDWLYICTATNTWRRVALGTWPTEP